MQIPEWCAAFVSYLLDTNLSVHLSESEQNASYVKHVSNICQYIINRLKMLPQSCIGIWSTERIFCVSLVIYWLAAGWCVLTWFIKFFVWRLFPSGKMIQIPWKIEHGYAAQRDINPIDVLAVENSDNVRTGKG